MLMALGLLVYSFVNMNSLSPCLEVVLFNFASDVLTDVLMMEDEHVTVLINYRLHSRNYSTGKLTNDIDVVSHTDISPNCINTCAC